MQTSFFIIILDKDFTNSNINLYIIKHKNVNVVYLHLNKKYFIKISCGVIFLFLTTY